MSDTVKTKLYCGHLCGDTVNTTCSFGQVVFDASGCAVVDVTEDDLIKLQSLGWVGEPPPPVLTIEEQAKASVQRTMVLLHAPDLKGEKVGTSFGVVQFDQDGMAEWNASDEELVKLHALRWVTQPQPTPENMERARASEPLRGPTIEEFVAAGYLPEMYPPAGYEKRDSAGLRAYESGGKVPWDERLVQAQREQLARDQAEQTARAAAQAKADASKAEIAARTDVMTMNVAEVPAPSTVAADAVPAPSAKQQAKQAQKVK